MIQIHTIIYCSIEIWNFLSISMSTPLCPNIYIFSLIILSKQLQNTTCIWVFCAPKSQTRKEKAYKNQRMSHWCVFFWCFSRLPTQISTPNSLVKFHEWVLLHKPPRLPVHHHRHKSPSSNTHRGHVWLPRPWISFPQSDPLRWWHLAMTSSWSVQQGRCFGRQMDPHMERDWLVKFEPTTKLW